jgi:flagella basal body P-ring formation protein FlgA
LKRSAGPALKPEAIVSGEIVRIGDLVENAGDAAGVPIFRAPDLGESGSVPAGRIAEAVLQYGIAILDIRGLTDVLVTRASHTLTPEDLQARIAKALAGRQPNTTVGNLTVNFDSEVRTIHVEPGTDLRIARLTFEPRSGRFDVLFERPGRTRSVIRFTGTYAETFEAAVLVRALAAGEVVRAADVAISRRPKAEFTANVVTNADQMVGLAPRRAMRAGQVLRQSDLSKPQVIARNDTVTITLEMPGIVLSMSGKALEAGAKGDLIGVLNVQSKRAIHATVAGPGHVIAASSGRVGAAPMAPRVAVNSTTPKARPNAE